MKNSMTKIVIETMARKAIRDIKEAPESSIRNIVEMALQFSNGRFQKRFFEIAHTMLQNETSGYYALVSDIVAHVDSERILNFGMNLGYNSCTTGAAKIREIEKHACYNVPWSVCLEIGIDSIQVHPEAYQQIIYEGEMLGIFTWMLFIEHYEKHIFHILKEHPESDFFVFCTPETVTEEFLDDLRLLNNVMVVVQYGETTAMICRRLRQEGVLYSCYYRYDRPDMEKICNGDLFYSMQQLHPIASVVIHKQGCPEAVQKSICQKVHEMRNSQEYKMALWELYGDNCYVDKVISDEECYLYFDRNGNLRNTFSGQKIGNGNLFHDSLQEILSQTFPKKQSA